MPREVEQGATAVLADTCGPPLPTSEWLVRPGKAECGAHWEPVREIYDRLTGLDLPEVMRAVERRTADGVCRFSDQAGPHLPTMRVVSGWDLAEEHNVTRQRLAV